MEAPPVIASERPRAFWWLAVAGAIAGCVAVLFAFNPSHYGFYPRCTLYTTTGLYCPGCGSLRALHQLSHGHLLTALHYNPLLMLSLPFVAGYGWRCFLNWRAGEAFPQLAFGSGWMKFIVAVTITFTILRNIPCAPFIYLAPP